MQVNSINNVSFKGKVWMVGKYFDKASDLKGVVYIPHNFRPTTGIHFDTDDVSYIYAINKDISVLHVHEGDKLMRAVVPYSIDDVLNVYNTAKNGPDIDIRNACKETYMHY